MRLVSRLVLILSVLGLVAAPSGDANVDATPASATGNVRHVANLAYETKYEQDLPFGTDIELRQYPNGRSYAFAGTYVNGLQIIDVTDPTKPAIAAVYDCALAQGDVQVFTQGDRVLVGYTADDYGPDYTKPESRCYRENGIADVVYGTFIVDVTDPTAPTTAGFVQLTKGSHNQTVHPSGNYLYNSNSDLGPGLGEVEIVDIRRVDKPGIAARLPLDTGIDSHDITFSADGTRAYIAAVSHTLVVDTTVPAKPVIIGRIVDPTINIHHQSEPFTIGEKTFLIVTDELAGAAGNGFCPGGGLHVFDITGDLERTPLKVGFFDIGDVGLTTGSSITCTSHVLKIHPAEQLMTIAWYAAGTRIIDLSGLAGPVPMMTEVGHAYFDDSDTWSAKALTVTRNGTFHVFANDMNRGLDVFAVTLKDGVAPAGTTAGRWRTPAELTVPTRALASSTPMPYCVLRPTA